MFMPMEVLFGDCRMFKILYDNYYFSIAWGKQKDGGDCVVMRWNRCAPGQEEHKRAVGTCWFPIPDEVALSLMQGLLGKDSTEDENVLGVLTELLSKPFAV